MGRMSVQPNLRETLSHEFLSSEEHYNVPIASPVSSPVTRARKNIISSMLKTSFHSKILEDHTASTESSSSSNSDKVQPVSSPRKSRKSQGCDKHSSPTRGKSGILKLLSERSLSPLKVSRSQRYSSCAGNESMSSLVTALKDVSQSLHSQMHDKGTTKKTSSSNLISGTDDSLSADEEKSFHSDRDGDVARSTFKPYGHYMINQCDTNTLWVSSDTAPRPHLELNISRIDSPHDLMVGRSTCKRRSPVRSKSLRFSIGAEKKDVATSRSKSSRRRRSSML